MTELWLSWAKRSPQHEPRAVGGGAVEDAGGGGQLGGGEGERRGQGVGVEAAALPEGVEADGQGGGPAGQHPPGGGLGVEQHRRAQRADPGALGLEVGFAAGVDSEVEADSEQALLASGQAGGQIAGVLGGYLDVGVGEAAFGGIGPTPRLQAGELAAQSVGRDVGGDRVDVHRHVEASGMGGERLQPPPGDLAGVADDGEAGAPAVPDPQRSGLDLDGVGPERGGRPEVGVRQARKQ